MPSSRSNTPTAAWPGSRSWPRCRLATACAKLAKTSRPARITMSPASTSSPAWRTLLPTGTRLGPRQIALLAAVGVGQVQVTPKPRVVVISTGDELIEAGTLPGFGQVVDSNGLMLTAAVRALDCIPFRVGCVRDDARTFLSTIESQLLRADAVITT